MSSSYHKQIDILAMAAHPDDIELACAGTILSQIEKGNSVGVLDFTRGELGTRGNADLRDKEAQKAAEILGLSFRDNLKLADGFFENNKESQLKIIEKLRKYRPKIVLINAPEDRHIDHGRAANLAHDACFLSGLKKITTLDENGNQQMPWRPQLILHYIQDQYLFPNIVIDITPFWEKKLEAIRAFESQFFNPNYQNTEDETPISSEDFWHFLEARARSFGRDVGYRYAEGFIKRTPIGAQNLFDLA